MLVALEGTLTGVAAVVVRLRNKAVLIFALGL